MISPRTLALLRSVRRRLRVAWASETLQLGAPAVLAAALVLVLAGRFVTALSWAEPAAIVVVVVGTGAVAVRAVTMRISDRMAARAVDRGLATNDAVEAALEFGAHDSAFGPAISARADHLAAAARPVDAVPLRFHRRPVVMAAVLGPAALALALLGNPQDEVRRRQAAEAAMVAEAADEIDAAADELELGGETAAAATERLRELAERLRESGSVEEAAVALDEAARELGAEVPPASLATKAATQGLEESLERRPLGDAPDASAAEQLDAAAAALAGATPAELADLADRLEDLAETQEAGDPATAEALDAAADAARAGDTAGAAARLGEAAAGHRAASADAAASDAASRAAGAARQAGDRLATGAGNGDRNGNGNGNGSGNGQGAGQGSGNGQGSGSGQGSGGGSPSGDVSGGGPSNGTPDGNRGGVGQGTGTAGDQAGQEPDTATIFDPAEFTDGETGAVGGGEQAGDGSTIGITDGPTTAGGRTVPLVDALPEYRSQATQALDRAAVPPSVRSLVLAYFDALQGRDG